MTHSGKDFTLGIAVAGLAAAGGLIYYLLHRPYGQTTQPPTPTPTPSPAPSPSGAPKVTNLRAGVR